MLSYFTMKYGPFSDNEGNIQIYKTSAFASNKLSSFDRTAAYFTCFKY